MSKTCWHCSDNFQNWLTGIIYKCHCKGEPIFWVDYSQVPQEHYHRSQANTYIKKKTLSSSFWVQGNLSQAMFYISLVYLPGKASPPHNYSPGVGTEERQLSLHSLKKGVERWSKKLYTQYTSYLLSRGMDYSFYESDYA